MNQESFLKNIYNEIENNQFQVSDELNEGEISIIYDFINTLLNYYRKKINSMQIIPTNNYNYKIESEREVNDFYNNKISKILFDKELIEKWLTERNLPIQGLKKMRN